MERDGYPKGLISRQQYYRTSHVANSLSQGFYKLFKTTNELQDALGLGRQVFRKGFFPLQELAAPQDPPHAAMVAVQTTAPRPQGVRKEKVYQQLAPAHNAKAEPDSIMKDVKLELGASCTLLTKVEALITRKRKPDDRKDQAMASIAHAVFACNTGRLLQNQYSRPAHQQLPSIGRQCRKTRSGAAMAWGPLLFSPSVQSTLWSYQINSNTKLVQGNNRKVQKGTAASGATRNMPASYMDFSESGDRGMRRRSILPTMCRHATKWNSSGPSRAQWSNQQNRSNPKWTTLAYLCYVVLTKSVRRFLSNFSSR
jgi:hypothetical protein